MCLYMCVLGLMLTCHHTPGGCSPSRALMCSVGFIAICMFLIFLVFRWKNCKLMLAQGKRLVKSWKHDRVLTPGIHKRQKSPRMLGLYGLWRKAAVNRFCPNTFVEFMTESDRFSGSVQFGFYCIALIMFTKHHIQETSKYKPLNTVFIFYKTFPDYTVLRIFRGF